MDKTSGSKVQTSASVTLLQTRKELKEKLQEQKVLQNELNTLKKSAKVYRQQQNSNVLFLSTIEKEMNRAKKTIDDLQKEYRGIEAMTSAQQGQEDSTDLSQSASS